MEKRLLGFCSDSQCRIIYQSVHNDTLNIDLSEQQLDSVVPSSTFAKGGYVGETYKYMISNDLVTVNSFPYRYKGYPDTVDGVDINYIYTTKCEDPDTIFKISGRKDISFKSSKLLKLKQNIISNPCGLTIGGGFAHAVECVGYKRIEAGDTVYIYTEQSQLNPDSAYKWIYEPYTIISDTSKYILLPFLVSENPKVRMGGGYGFWGHFFGKLYSPF